MMKTGTLRMAALLATTLFAASGAMAQDVIDEAGPAKRQLLGAQRTGEALWPVPQQALWGKVIEQKGSHIWKDAVYTDPNGRWQIVYPSTMIEPFGGIGREVMWRYPGQPHITCGTRIKHGAFDSLGVDVAVRAVQALAEHRDELVAMMVWKGTPASNVQMITLPSPPGVAGKPVQAIQFDQTGKLLEPLGVNRDVVMRSLLVSDGNDLLHAFCTAHPGQKKWVEKDTPLMLRLTELAREEQ